MHFRGTFSGNLVQKWLGYSTNKDLDILHIFMLTLKCFIFCLANVGEACDPNNNECDGPNTECPDEATDICACTSGKVAWANSVRDKKGCKGM